jgi:hypothetical protein
MGSGRREEVHDGVALGKRGWPRHGGTSGGGLATGWQRQWQREPVRLIDEISGRSDAAIVAQYRGNISRSVLLTYPRRQKLMTTAPSVDEAAADVLAAFQAAREAGRPPVECYRAGVEAWRRHHPDQAPEYAAKRAVAVILAHNIELKVGD